LIGLDTNVLARYLIESGQVLFMHKTVAPELEWVLHGYYRFNRDQDGLVLDALLNLLTLQLEDRAAIEQALAGLRAGLDFADALHHASFRACTAIASFDRRSFANPARDLNLQPRRSHPADVLQFKPKSRQQLTSLEIGNSHNEVRLVYSLPDLDCQLLRVPARTSIFSTVGGILR